MTTAAALLAASAAHACICSERLGFATSPHAVSTRHSEDTFTERPGGVSFRCWHDATECNVPSSARQPHVTTQHATPFVQEVCSNRDGCVNGLIVWSLDAQGALQQGRSRVVPGPIWRPVPWQGALDVSVWFSVPHEHSAPPPRCAVMDAIYDAPDPACRNNSHAPPPPPSPRAPRMSSDSAQHSWQASGVLRSPAVPPHRALLVYHCFHAPHATAKASLPGRHMWTHSYTSFTA